MWVRDDFKLWGGSLVKKVQIVILVIIVTIIAIIKIGDVLLTDFMCGNEILAESVSRNGKVKAVIFDRGCGVGSSDSTQVSLIANGKKLKNKPGNIFVKSGKGNVKTIWLDDKVLLIQFTDALKIYKQKNTYKGVSIKYEYAHL